MKIDLDEFQTRQIRELLQGDLGSSLERVQEVLKRKDIDSAMAHLNDMYLTLDLLMHVDYAARRAVYEEEDKDDAGVGATMPAPTLAVVPAQIKQ